MTKKKYSKKVVENMVSKIRAEGKLRIAKIDKPYEKSEKRMSLLLSIPEEKTLKGFKEIRAYREKLGQEQKEQERLEKRSRKDKFRKGFIKVETKTQVALERGLAAIKKLSKQKVKSKKVLRGQRPTLVLKQREVPSVLNDESRFFQREMEETKRSMFA